MKYHFSQSICYKNSVRESILRNTEKLQKNYKLIKPSRAAPVPFALHELVYKDTEITTNEVLKGIGLK